MIKKWKKFKESISGTTDTQRIGPGFGDQSFPSTLTKDETELIEGKDGVIYGFDQFKDLLNDYLKLPQQKNKRDLSEFNKENLDLLLQIFGK